MIAGCDTGGMDGAGGIIIPQLFNHHQVFLQSIWERDQLSYVVFNERSEDIEVAVHEGCGAYCGGLGAVLGRWAVPARSVRRFPSDKLSARPLGSVDLTSGVQLGILPVQEPPPVAGTLAIVSNTMDTMGWSTRSGQIESSSVVTPNGSSTLHLVLAAGGQLRIPAQREPSFVPWLEVTEVRTEAGAVPQTGDAFVLDVPDSASVASPVRLEVDVKVPTAAEGRLIVGFAASLCPHGQESGCASRLDGPPGLVRWFQLAE